MPQLTSVGVPGLGEVLSTLGLGVTEFGDRSMEKRPFCNGEIESPLGLATPLLTRGVAGDDLAFGVPDTVDLHKQKILNLFFPTLAKIAKIHKRHSIHIAGMKSNSNQNGYNPNIEYTTNEKSKKIHMKLKTL